MICSHNKSQIVQTMPVFRFKLSPELLNLMNEFAKIHRYDDREIFKEEYENWLKSNIEIIENEKSRLDTLGYKGTTENLQDKIYHSIRYYFRKQLIKPKEDSSESICDKVKTKTYERLPKTVIDNIDEYIRNHIDAKPSILYKEYYEMFERQRDDIGSANDLAEERIKKAFKNRHYRLTCNT